MIAKVFVNNTDKIDKNYLKYLCKMNMLKHLINKNLLDVLIFNKASVQIKNEYVSKLK